MSRGSYVSALTGRIRRHGWRGALREVTRRGVERLTQAQAWDEPVLPLRQEDVHAGPGLPAVPGRSLDRLRIGWLCFPPRAGSGGHTTLFRMVRALEERGHECTLILYDPHSEDVSRHEAVIRRAWPHLCARVAGVAEGLDGYDAVVASSWATAHVVASRNGSAVPFYFIQDYEPFFYPHGYLYELAERTYGLGLQNIALGGMVAMELERQAGIVPDAVVPFGCDTATYRLLAPPEAPPRRRGVVYYAKRTADRRGYLLARAALERFHALVPDEPVHIVGDTVPGWTVPVIQHGSVPPAELNRIYNGTIASLAMSFTNVSLVPGELLAAGNVPVLNDLPGPRLDLDSPYAVWAPGTPDGLAEALAAAVSGGPVDINARARRIAAHPPPSWATAQAVTADFIEGRVRTGSTARPGGHPRELAPPPSPPLSVPGFP